MLDNGEVVDVSLSEKFWTTCPELRSSTIGRWMLDLGGVIPWAKGKSPEFDLEPAGGTATVLTFALTEIEDSPRSASP
ncbi:hypothetical protein [Methanoculleus sp. 10]|uniref:hypothetical protein n=1 Tax=Methanoculleus sp. 10 TaxID=430615 RepID=UPI0025E182AE|nr:hypothetical protein [Methanoculleus sp. 10]